MSYDNAQQAVYFGRDARGQCDSSYATGLRDTDGSRVFLLVVVRYGEREGEITVWLLLLLLTLWQMF